MAYGYLLAAGGSLLGSYLSAQGSKGAAQTQSDAQMRAAEIQQQMFNRIVAQEQPFLQTGYNATNALNSLMGFGNTNYGMGPMGNGPQGYTAPNYQPGSPNAGTGATDISGNASGSNLGALNFVGGGDVSGFNVPDMAAAGEYGPQTLTTGGNTLTGSTGPSWEQMAAAAAAGIAGGPLAALMAGKMAGPSNEFTFNGQTFKGPKVTPTSVKMPVTTTTIPGQIIDPATGAPIGTPYYSTPGGQRSMAQNNMAIGNLGALFQGSTGRNGLTGSSLIGKSTLAARKYGGPVAAPDNASQSVMVGEDGPEVLHLAPGSQGYVVPNPGTMEKMRRGTHLPRSGGGGYPGRLLGGPVGGPVSRYVGPNSATWRPTGQIGAFTGGPASGPTIANPSNPASGPVHNAIGGAGSQPGMGFGSGATGAASGPLGGFGTTGLTGIGTGATGVGGSNYQPPGVSPNPMQNGGLTVGSASNNPGYLMQTYTPQAFNPTQADLTNYPGYQFQLQQGDLAVQNSAAAKYGALSGAAMKDLSNYNQDLAASNYNQYFNQYQQQQGNMFNMFQTQQNNIFNRLQQLSALGQNAAGNLGSQGANLGTGIAQANAAAGGSLAGGQLGAANAYAGAANTIPLYMLLANQGGG